MYHRVIASKERYSTIPANSFDFMCYNYFIITDIITTNILCLIKKKKH
jgi:hypothetical protein